LDFVAPALVFFSMRLGILDHSVDLFLRELSRSADRDLLFFTCFFVFRRDS
jgi:hypothetical protein